MRAKLFAGMSLGCGLLMAPGTGLAASYVEAIVFRTIDEHSMPPLNGYEGEIGIHVDSGISGVTSVTLSRGGSSLALTPESDGWYFDLSATTLSDIRTGFTGAFVAQVQYGASKTATLSFTLNMSSLTNDSFPDMPTITSPLNNQYFASGSPVTATWNYPSGSSSDLRFAGLDLQSGGYVDYEFPAGTTSWDLGTPADGHYSLEVQYANAAPSTEIANLLTNVSAVSDDAGFWGTSPYAPAYWSGLTAGSPLLASVASHEVGFTVAVPEPTTLSIVCVAGLLLGRRNRR